MLHVASVLLLNQFIVSRGERSTDWFIKPSTYSLYKHMPAFQLWLAMLAIPKQHYTICDDMFNWSTSEKEWNKIPISQSKPQGDTTIVLGCWPHLTPCYIFKPCLLSCFHPYKAKHSSNHWDDSANSSITPLTYLNSFLWIYFSTIAWPRLCSSV